MKSKAKERRRTSSRQSSRESEEVSGTRLGVEAGVVVLGSADDGEASGDGDALAESIARRRVARRQLVDLRPRRTTVRGAEYMGRTRVGAGVVVLRSADDGERFRDADGPAELIVESRVARLQLRGLRPRRAAISAAKEIRGAREGRVAVKRAQRSADDGETPGYAHRDAEEVVNLRVVRRQLRGLRPCRAAVEELRNTQTDQPNRSLSAASSAVNLATCGQVVPPSELR
mmetsp:Transcript_13295/g.40215  ORF Transcript_13295/g.40215 Transcript_13295/m.40215 type:complete len:230 (+) Transcript_13295:65-754(+)